MTLQPGDIARVMRHDLIFGNAVTGDVGEVEEDELLLVLGIDDDDIDKRIINVFRPGWGVGWMTMEHLEVISEAR